MELKFLNHLMSNNTGLFIRFDDICEKYEMELY